MRTKKTCQECGTALHGNSQRTHCDDHLDLMLCTYGGCSKPRHKVKDDYRGSKQKWLLYKYCSVHEFRRRNSRDMDTPFRHERLPDLTDYNGWRNWVLASIEINDHGCWVWQRAINPESGYGQCGFKYPLPSNAHRLAYWAWNGGPEMRGLHIDHQCHLVSAAPDPNRACVNPQHLNLREPKDNNAERVFRTAMRKRVAELEQALREILPTHPLLGV